MNKISDNTKGLSGLANLGNTCYMNSCIQILFHTNEIYDILVNKINEKNFNNDISSTFSNEWIKLRDILWDNNVIVSPNKFLKTIHFIANKKGWDDFTGYEQNDATEFLIFVLNLFHESIMRSVNITISGKVKNNKDKLALICYKKIENMFTNEYSEFIPILYGVQVNCFYNINTSKLVKVHPDPFSIICLPILNTHYSDIYDCFDEYLTEEHMIGDDGLIDEKTKKHFDTKKQIIFWSLPDIFIVSFKRFDNHGKKNRFNLKFPLEGLDMTKYIYGYNKDNYIYDLYGVCNHTGVCNGGHYTSYIKTQNKWYHFNDTSVSEIKPNIIVSAKAYCLFYRKRKTS